MWNLVYVVALMSLPRVYVATAQPQAQTIGLFAHQVMMRGVEWRRVSGTRFVPPGETAASAIFVEWRREGSKWVVSSFGDESFSRLPLPPWINWRDRKPSTPSFSLFLRVSA
jgi:hypothetical protein